ncbi:MAG: UDP-N-acetylmuramate dehydrogenase [Anaerolineaceae bacterium]
MTENDSMTLQNHFGDRLQTNVRLARYTTARVGGEVRWFAESSSAAQLTDDARFLWGQKMPFRVLGNGSNILVSDLGWNGMMLYNQAKAISVDLSGSQPILKAESGATLSAVVRTTIDQGLSGFEWAAGIPGTIGGAVYGNAGARGLDTRQILALAEILHREKGELSLTSIQMGYEYRSSNLKRNPGQAIVLTASFNMLPSSPALVKEKVEEFNTKRRNSQPAGASMGSTFKNPVGDFAGRLIEASGLKGSKIGGVEVSPIHANFLVNDGSASAQDYHKLISLVQKTVKEKFSVDLDLEIELLGEWQD